ncbi:leukocyte-associated immunoglobulin-like receptor 1 isoform X2 [Phoca vitulina]|uniref:leukocyte-associated immunoglobulin-like receptor 1 isoform X2 n=1 Tax=Phoca vitulina TaxID=9720 RepID=UPI001395F2CF|nr:leukocyte-associated immunoglobulin-like receptor 1 isoform X2 [Phoca vitulina]
MSPHLTTFLALALCLGRVLQAREGALPRPSIWAEPGSVIPQGQPVTIVCQGPAEAETFRLEKEGDALHPDAQNPQHETQARFRIRAASEDTAGLYHCLYHKGVDWSERSAPLQLEVTGFRWVLNAQTHQAEWDRPWGPPPSISPSVLVTETPHPSTHTYSSAGDPQMHWEDSNSPGLSTEHVSILIGISVALFLCVLLLVLIFLYYQHQKKHMPPSSKGEEQRPQERVSLAVDILERTPDLATVDRLPEKDGEMLHTPFGSRLAEWFWLRVFLEVAVKMWTTSRMALHPPPRLLAGCSVLPGLLHGSWPPPEGGHREGGPEATLCPHSAIVYWSPRPALILSGRELHTVVIPADPYCRRPPGRDICSAGPPDPHTEDGPSRIPAVHGAHG